MDDTFRIVDTNTGVVKLRDSLSEFECLLAIVALDLDIRRLTNWIFLRDDMLTLSDTTYSSVVFDTTAT